MVLAWAWSLPQCQSTLLKSPLQTWGYHQNLHWQPLDHQWSWGYPHKYQKCCWYPHSIILISKTPKVNPALAPNKSTYNPISAVSCHPNTPTSTTTTTLPILTYSEKCYAETSGFPVKPAGFDYCLRHYVFYYELTPMSYLISKLIHCIPKT